MSREDVVAVAVRPFAVFLIVLSLRFATSIAGIVVRGETWPFCWRRLSSHQSMQSLGRHYVGPHQTPGPAKAPAWHASTTRTYSARHPASGVSSRSTP